MKVYKFLYIVLYPVAFLLSFYSGRLNTYFSEISNLSFDLSPLLAYQCAAGAVFAALILGRGFINFSLTTWKPRVILNVVFLLLSVAAFIISLKTPVAIPAYVSALLTADLINLLVSFRKPNNEP